MNERILRRKNLQRARKRYTSSREVRALSALCVLRVCDFALLVAASLFPAKLPLVLRLAARGNIASKKYLSSVSFTLSFNTGKSQLRGKLHGPPLSMEIKTKNTSFRVNVSITKSAIALPVLCKMKEYKTTNLTQEFKRKRYKTGRMAILESPDNLPRQNAFFAKSCFCA